VLLITEKRRARGEGGWRRGDHGELLYPIRCSSSTCKGRGEGVLIPLQVRGLGPARWAAKVRRGRGLAGLGGWAAGLL
jgi:hypothetical protein